MKRVVCFFGFVFVLSVGCLFFDTLLQEKGAYLAALEAETASLRRECALLESQIAEVTSPSYLALRAEEMGMVLAEEDDRAFLAEEAEPVPPKDVLEDDLFARIGTWIFQ